MPCSSGMRTCENFFFQNSFRLWHPWARFVENFVWRASCWTVNPAWKVHQSGWCLSVCPYQRVVRLPGPYTCSGYKTWMTLMSWPHPKHRIANAKWATCFIHPDVLQFRLSNPHNEFLLAGGTGFPPTVTGNLRSCCGVQKSRHNGSNTRFQVCWLDLDGRVVHYFYLNLEQI